MIKGAIKSLTYEKVFNLALELFDYDRDKTLSWWMNKSKELGDLSPFEMVKEGKGRQLIRYIDRCHL